MKLIAMKSNGFAFSRELDKLDVNACYVVRILGTEMINDCECILYLNEETGKTCFVKNRLGGTSSKEEQKKFLEEWEDSCSVVETNSVKIKFRKLYPDAVVPEYKSKKASGFDLSAYIGVEKSNRMELIHPGHHAVIGTGIAMSFPDGYGLQIRSRSGLAAKVAVSVLNSPGTIDEDYVDELKIILFNHGEKDFYIKHGDRIAQGVIEKVIQGQLIESEFGEEEARKDRGGGLGSTGVSAVIGTKG